MEKLRTEPKGKLFRTFQQKRGPPEPSRRGTRLQIYYSDKVRRNGKDTACSVFLFRYSVSAALKKAITIRRTRTAR